MKNEAHGGDLLAMATLAGRDPASLLDFSVNIRPEGTPDFLRGALLRADSALSAYPSPHAEEAQAAAERHHGLPASRFVFGNGSNELIHALARVLRKQGTPRAFIVEPAFSEYALACRLAGLETCSLWGGLSIPDQTEGNALLLELAAAPSGSAVFLANPGNPSGIFRSRTACLHLLTARPDLLWILDEAFIDYAGPEKEVSLLQVLPENGVILRSLTKFHALPGVRVGYMAASETLAAAVRAELPVWNVNCFAIAAAVAALDDSSDFGEQTRTTNAERRDHLATVLAGLPGLEIFPSAANYILFRWPEAPRDLHALLLRRFGIAIRDCANYHGLEDGTWFRVAVRFPADHERLADALRTIICERRAGSLSPEIGTCQSPVSEVSLNETCQETETPQQAREIMKFSLPDSLNLSSVASTQATPGEDTPTRSAVSSAPSFPKNSANTIAESPAISVTRDVSPSDITDAAQNTFSSIQGFLPTGSSSVKKGRSTPALMLQGTSSNAGKSILAAAFCRIFAQDGYSVAPFKAQNMSLNSGVTPTGEEMSRAQLVQAQAARVDPDVRMNPILLKPHSDTGSQVILLGQAHGHMGALDYFNRKQTFWSTVTRAYDSLAAEHDLMILEGAGSPAEINLKSHDLVNMRMAAHAGASVLLVGDIDRGGVYASFLGTWLTFTPAERHLLAGYLVNRFRGDASLLASAHRTMHTFTGIPVLGTIPFIPHIGIPEEDMAGFFWTHRDESGPAAPDTLDIAVVVPQHVSNYTDFAPLAAEPDVRLRSVRQAEDWGTPQVVILPGSKSVVDDLAALQRCGLAELIVQHARKGGWIFGICGGLQMLGQAILDPDGVESRSSETPGLGLMELRSTFMPGKTLVQVPEAQTPLGVPSSGYEIHHARTEHGPSARPLFMRPARSAGDTGVCGYVTGRCWATYLHGIFDNDTFRRTWIDHVRADLGMQVQGRILVRYDLERALDRLAAVVREHVDMETIYQRLGLS